MKRLMVLIPDRLSDLVIKGEITARYYNPNDLFDEVHIIMTNDDQVDPGAVQKAVGNARLQLYNLPARGVFIRSLGWRPFLLAGWAESAIRLAREIRPCLVRCHGCHLNAYLASRIKSVLGIPCVISLHTNPDDDVVRKASNWKDRVDRSAIESVARMALRQADMVLPVYQGILPYLKRMGVERYRVVYNVLNPVFLGKKNDYRLHEPVRIISVGRQIEGKNPENIIRALKDLPGTHLTLIGDGTHHEYLQRIVQECQVQDRVTSYRSLSNDELCSQMSDYDIFAAHSEYWGLPKAVMEPLLVGLPVVLNRRSGTPVEEFADDFPLLVENTVEGYKEGLRCLIENGSFRENLGRKSYAHAQENWAPWKMESKVVELYETVMNDGARFKAAAT